MNPGRAALVQAAPCDPVAVFPDPVGVRSDSRGGGSGEMVRDGGSRSGGTLGYWQRAGGGTEAARATRAQVEAVARRDTARHNCSRRAIRRLPGQAGAHAAGSRQSDNSSPEDVALKIDKPADINNQGGQAQNVEEGEDGDGIRITDGSAVQFPNNVSPTRRRFVQYPTRLERQ
jgi:hypothetical protein